MTIFDQKRILTLAGLLKESMEEWPQGVAEGVYEEETTGGEEEVRKIIRDMNAEVMKNASKDDFLLLLSADALIKSGVNTPEKLKAYFEAEDARERYKEDLARQWDDYGDDFSDYVRDVDKDMPTTWDEEEEEDEEEELERLPLRMPMGRLEETIRSMVREMILEKAKTYKGKSMRLGGGGRFQKLVDDLKKKGKTEKQAKALAAVIGRKKYGKAKMKKMAAAGKKREAKKD